MSLGQLAEMFDRGRGRPGSRVKGHQRTDVADGHAVVLAQEELVVRLEGVHPAEWCRIRSVRSARGADRDPPLEPARSPPPRQPAGARARGPGACGRRVGARGGSRRDRAGGCRAARRRSDPRRRAQSRLHAWGRARGGARRGGGRTGDRARSPRAGRSRRLRLHVPGRPSGGRVAGASARVLGPTLPPGAGRVEDPEVVRRASAAGPPSEELVQAVRDSREEIGLRWGLELGGLREVAENPGDLNLVYTTPEIAGAAAPDDSWRFVGPLLDPVEAAPARERDAPPLVYMALGTLFNNQPTIFRAAHRRARRRGRTPAHLDGPAPRTPGFRAATAERHGRRLRRVESSPLGRRRPHHPRWRELRP